MGTWIIHYVHRMEYLDGHEFRGGTGCVGSSEKTSDVRSQTASRSLNLLVSSGPIFIEEEKEEEEGERKSAGRMLQLSGRNRRKREEDRKRDD